MTRLLLTELGYDVELVVTEMEDIPLKTRVQRVNDICNQIGPENVLLLSIHSNACGNGKNWMNAKGWSAYTTPGKTESDNVAECLYKAFEEEFKDRKIRKDTSDGDSDWEERFYIIQKTYCPAVLLENFFYDNKEECQWLLLESTQKRIANAIVKGIKLYCKQRF